MKINPPPRVAPTSSVSSARSIKQTAPAAAASSTGPSVQLSSEASFAQAMREAAQNAPEVRSDLVQQAKQDIANGQLGTIDDYERAISALLMEL
ncbi:MAG: flagellar biosynthesis anti-sigma factor FlgM [Myxococcota bacterium]|nr:flagellar biosynthesis anti-sigma factor FlgM [Myxococcota bacterium]